MIFGGASLPATIDLANLGLAGVTIFGADARDYSGRSVSSAGDVNGDGFDDLLIGARETDTSGASVVLHTDGILSRAVLARRTFSRMSSAFLVQTKDLG